MKSLTDQVKKLKDELYFQKQDHRKEMGAKKELIDKLESKQDVNFVD